MKQSYKYNYNIVKQALQNSLSYLELDYVDLYYYYYIPFLEGAIKFAQVYNEFKEECLIKKFALSEIALKWLKKIHLEARPVGVIQQEQSMLTHNLENELVPICKELDILIVAYSPIIRNVLVCVNIKIVLNDWRAILLRFSAENLEKTPFTIRYYRLHYYKV